MRNETLPFLIALFLALLSWVAAFICCVRARRHYVGPRGLLAFIFPIGRLRPSNYTTRGVSILRWQFVFMIAFLLVIALATGIGNGFRG